MKQGRRGGRHSDPSPRGRPPDREDNASTPPSSPSAPFTLPPLAHRFVERWLAIFRSQPVLQAPFSLCYSRGQIPVEIPPQVLVECLAESSKENLLNEHLGYVARALLPMECYPRLVVTLEPVALEFAKIVPGSEPRFIFPLTAASPVLLGAYVTYRNTPHYIVWTTENEDPSIADFTPRRSITVHLPANALDRMTYALFMLMRLTKFDPAAALDDRTPYPGGAIARKYLLWELLRQANMQLYLPPPSESAALIALVHKSQEDAFNALDVKPPEWYMTLRKAMGDSSQNVNEALQNALIQSTKSKLFVVPVTEAAGHHSFQFTRDADAHQVVLIATRETAARKKEYLGLLRVYPEHDRLWMRTSAAARPAIGLLHVDARQSVSFDANNRYCISQGVHGGHMIEFMIEEHRVTLTVLFDMPPTLTHSATAETIPLAPDGGDPMVDHDELPPAEGSASAAPPTLTHIVASPPPAPVPHVQQQQQQQQHHHHQQQQQNHHAPPQSSPQPPPPPLPLPLPLSVASTAPMSDAMSGPENGPLVTKKKPGRKTATREFEATLRGALLRNHPIGIPDCDEGWWHSWRSVLKRFTKSMGRIVWFTRSSTDSKVWKQRPVGCSLPSDAPSPTVRSWWDWHMAVVNKGTADVITDLYYLIDVEVQREDLDKLIKAIPILQALDDETSVYSLHRYIVRVLGATFALPDLRPRLSFAPGLVSGAISTPVHIDGVGHLLSYHWLLGFDAMASTLVDLFGREEDFKDRPERWKILLDKCPALSTNWYAQPHRLEHETRTDIRAGCDKAAELARLGIKSTSVEVKPGTVLLIGAGTPCAIKKMSSSVMGPLVSLEGQIAWLGFDHEMARMSIDRMKQVEKTLPKPLCYPAIAMLCCLVMVPTNEDEAALQHEHIKGAQAMLQELLLHENNMLTALNKHIPVQIDSETRAQAWSCHSCSTVMPNAIMFCRVRQSRRAFCVDCAAEGATLGEEMLDEKKNASPEPAQLSARIIRTNGKRVRDDQSDLEGLGDGERDYDDNVLDDDEVPDDVDDVHSHQDASWKDHHIHELVFRFGPPQELLASLANLVAAPQQLTKRKAAGRSPRSPRTPRSSSAPRTSSPASPAAASSQATAAGYYSSAPESPGPNPHSPASMYASMQQPPAMNNSDVLLPLLEEMAQQRRRDIDHNYCRQLQDLQVECSMQVARIEEESNAASPSSQRPKRARGAGAGVLVSATSEFLERILRVMADLLRYCHDERDDGRCFMRSEEVAKFLETEYGKRVRGRRKCRVCNKEATWDRPTHLCIRQHRDSEYSFHLECCKYPSNIAFNVPMFCSECLKESAEQRSVSLDLLRRQHLWEQARAAAELYSMGGFKIVEVPPNGLCFFTVLYLLAHQTTVMPDPELLLTWINGRPHQLLVAAASAPDAQAPLREARAEIESWPSRTIDQWRTHWNLNSFDTAATILPALLERNRILRQSYFRYSFDSSLNAGRWFLADGSAYLLEESQPQPPADVNYAVLRIETPTQHYNLLVRGGLH